MADKEIVDLTQAESVGDDILLPCYVPGSTDPAQHLTGAQFKAAFTPVRGEDYWTEEEKEEMVNAVIDALPVYSGGTGSVEDDLPLYDGSTEELA